MSYKPDSVLYQFPKIIAHKHMSYCQIFLIKKFIICRYYRAFFSSQFAKIYILLSQLFSGIGIGWPFI